MKKKQPKVHDWYITDDVPDTYVSYTSTSPAKNQTTPERLKAIEQRLDYIELPWYKRIACFWNSL